MSAPDRFGELRSLLAEPPDEDTWPGIVAMLECWPDTRDEVAWRYAADRLDDLDTSPRPAPRRLVRRLLDGGDAHAILACGALDIVPFDREEAGHVAELLRGGLRSVSVAFRGGKVQCVDVDEEAEPAVRFSNDNSSNDLMLITVCAAVHPMVPTTGMGAKLAKINDGSHYAIVAFSAYVVEPV